MTQERTLRIEVAPVFEPLCHPARYKAAYGGRGTGKSHFFAGLMVEDAVRYPGFLGVCIREVQHTLQESAKRLIETKLIECQLSERDGFVVFNDRIKTPGGGLLIFQGMQDHTAESIKSLEGYQRAWVEEAQTLSQRSLDLLRPTIRAEESEIWFSWNPTRKNDPVDMLFRGKTEDGQVMRPTGSVVVQTSYKDNPWWNSVLEQERRDCMRMQPDQYSHIYEGDYSRIATGAYYAQSLAEMRAQKRLTRVAADPLMAYQAFWDIGGSGARADHTVIWIAQFIGREIRVLDFYEAQGQPLATHIAWMRSRGYKTALCVLPHDGSTHEKVYSISYESFLKKAGFDTKVIPNQGKGAANARIESVRRLFPRIWMNEATCEPGLDALGSYRPRIDEKRSLDLGPEHDWSSHASDAFGLLCICYEEPQLKKQKDRWANTKTKSWLTV